MTFALSLQTFQLKAALSFGKALWQLYERLLKQDLLSATKVVYLPTVMAAQNSMRKYSSAAQPSYDMVYHIAVQRGAIITWSVLS